RRGAVVAGWRHEMMFLLPPYDTRSPRARNGARKTGPRRGPRQGSPGRERGTVGSPGQCVAPVRLDLVHQGVGQRHVAERAGLGVAVGVDPAEELARVARAFHVPRLL